MIIRATGELSRADLSAEISAAIITAIKFYETDRFHFNEARAELTTSISQAEYALPSDFQGVDSVIIQVNQYIYELNPRPYTWILAHDTNPNYLGRPYDFAIYAEFLRVYPMPQDEYILTMQYHKKLALSDSASMSNAWFTEGEELIRLHAKIDVLENRIRGQEAFQEAIVLRGREQTVLDKLEAEYSARTNIGKLTPTKY
jgi:hypothetical protein